MEPDNLSLTPALVTQIRSLVENGVPATLAGESLGIPTSLMKNWINRGQQENYGIYYQLVRNIAQGRAKFEIRHILLLGAGAPAEPRNSKYLLEKLRKKRWGEETHINTGDQVNILNINSLEALPDSKKKQVYDSLMAPAEEILALPAESYKLSDPEAITSPTWDNSDLDIEWDNL